MNFPSAPHPLLPKILSGDTSLSAGGYPIISEKSFELFLNNIPHLFKDGAVVLRWLAAVKQNLEQTPYARAQQEASVLRAVDVLETVTRTANITAPTDLWLLRQILATHQRIGSLSWMRRKAAFTRAQLASAFNLDETFLRHDLDFLLSRDYLTASSAQQFCMSALPQVQYTIEHLTDLPDREANYWVATFLEAFSSPSSDNAQKPLEAFLIFTDQSETRQGWPPTLSEIEYGYRLVPLVLALRKHGPSKQPWRKLPVVAHFLERGGLVETGGAASALGERVFNRAPGPFGIIYAYLDYMRQHENLLRGNRQNVWVARGENVAASRDANAKTFALINDSLDRFCRDQNFQFNVFIEHAVGYGEATRQRFEKDGEAHIQYFGADLEDAAIERAMQAQAQGDLPHNMRFIRRADIGDPQKLIQGIEAAGCKTQNAVMVVGNGFHEIRRQTNEKMVEVFRAYKNAGLILIFTEESALTNDDLRATAWNTYHAGFRYTHAISGQELRPVYDVDAGSDLPQVFSWEKCVTLAGYHLLKKYTTRTRTIYPYPRPDGRNPAISVNYFCAPMFVPDPS